MHSLMQTLDRISLPRCPWLFLSLTSSCITRPIVNHPQESDEHISTIHLEYNALPLIEAQQAEASSPTTQTPVDRHRTTSWLHISLGYVWQVPLPLYKNPEFAGVWIHVNVQKLIKHRHRIHHELSTHLPQQPSGNPYPAHFHHHIFHPVRCCFCMGIQSTQQGVYGWRRCLFYPVSINLCTSTPTPNSISYSIPVANRRPNRPHTLSSGPS